MSGKKSLSVSFIAIIGVATIIGCLVGWDLSEFETIVTGILIKSLMAMTFTWLILATSSTSILYRGRAPRTLTFALLLLSIGGLGLTELVSGGLPRGTLAILTVQWAGLAMGASIVLFTILAIATGRDDEEDSLLAMDQS